MAARDRCFLVAQALTLVGALAALSAAAEEARKSDQIEEIVVTAQKRTQSISDVGMTIQAAPAITLADRGIEGPEDLSKLVSGFTATKSIYETPVYTLRGIGLYDATFGAPPAVAIYTDQIPRNFPVMSSALDLDLERVEVLKGPQGTLFGQSATGGAVNYITAKPTDKFAAGLDLSDERFDKQTISGFISGPLSDTVKARFAVRAIQGGAWQYSQSRPNDENGATRKLEGRVTVDWTPTDRVSIETSFTAARDRSDPQAPQYVGTKYDLYSAAALAAANANPATRNPYGVVNDAVYAGYTTPGSPNYDATFLANQTTLVTRMNNTAVGAAASAAGARALLGTPLATGNPRAAEWTPGLLGPANNGYFQGTLRADFKVTDSVTLTSLSAFSHQKLDYDQDLDATTAAAPNVPIWGTVSAFNQELRLSGNSSKVNWLVGGSYDNSDSRQSNDYLLADYSGNSPIPGLAPISSTLNNFSSTLKTYAGFANGEFKITPNFSASAGVRYTKNDETASYCYNDPASDPGQSTAAVFSIFQGLFTGQKLPPILPGQCFPLGDGLSGTTFGKATLTPVNRSLDQSNVSYRAGLDYKFDQGTLIYGTVSQGYKAGLFSAIGASSTSQYAPAVQEKVVAYETGFKAPMFDRRLNLNGAIFYYDYRNKQVRGDVLDAIYGLLEKMINVPKSYVYGVEGELAARPVEGLTLSASATYLKSEVSSSFSKTLDGSQVYNASGYTGNFKGSNLPFTPKVSANADIEYQWSTGRSWAPFLGGNVLYQSSENTTFSNSVLLAGDFEIPSYVTLDLRAGVRSGDGKWQVTAYGRNVTNKDYTTSITSYLDTRFRLTGQPAIYGVSLRMNFN
jgi:iron complex outermembrane receptor protein